MSFTKMYIVPIVFGLGFSLIGCSIDYGNGFHTPEQRYASDQEAHKFAAKVNGKLMDTVRERYSPNVREYNVQIEYNLYEFKCNRTNNEIFCYYDDNRGRRWR